MCFPEKKNGPKHPTQKTVHRKRCHVMQLGSIGKSEGMETSKVQKRKDEGPNDELFVPPKFNMEPKN